MGVDEIPTITHHRIRPVLTSCAIFIFTTLEEVISPRIDYCLNNLKCRFCTLQLRLEADVGGSKTY